MKSRFEFDAVYPTSARSGVAAAASLLNDPADPSEQPGRAVQSLSGGLSHAELRDAPTEMARGWSRLGSLLCFCFVLCVALAGCGGGYPGLGLTGITAPVAIDAGQSTPVAVTGPSGFPVSWSISGSGCSGSSCGTLTGMSGAGGTYTAPIAVSSPMQVTLTATIPGTTSTRGTAITVNPDPSLSGVLPSGTVGVPYTATLRGSGGTGALTLAITSGSLPSGLTFNPGTGVISGTPTAAGTANFVAQVTDSSPTPFTVKASESITITAAVAALQFLSGNPPSGVVGTPYATALTAAGGTTPYTFSLVGGALPAGLTLSSTGIIAGIPTTAGTFPFTAQVQDAAGAKTTASFSITVATGSSSLSITVGSLPNGTVGIPYTSTIGVAGGSAPYTCSVTAGALPVGLTLGAGCVVSGTPTVAGTANLTVKAVDSSNPVQTTTGPVSLTISPAGLSLSTGSLPAGTVGTPYSSTIGVAGGSSPYSCTLVSGALQAGLTLGPNCLVSGTPTVAGTVNLTVKATDSGNPVQTVTGPVSLTVNPAVMLTLTAPVAGTVGTPYTGAIGVSGGTGPYTCVLNSGTLQTGLTFNSNCTLTGTPTSSGTSTLSVTATDASSPANSTTGNVAVTINPAPVTITISNPPVATVGMQYTGVVPVGGGTGPYTCSVASGTLPAGLSFSTGCTLTGTPSAPGSTTVQVKAVDSANPPHTMTGPVTVTVQGPALLTFKGSLPNAILNQPYSQTLAASGGVGPYTYAVTSGALPAGLSLATTTGIISGTPTVPGASTFTVTATDSESPAQTAPLPLTLLVVYAPTPTDALLQGPYAFLFQGNDNAIAGVLAYRNATIGSFTANGSGVLTTGELDTNRQGSNPTGAQVPTNALLGTYTLAPDANDPGIRGTLVISTFNANGTVAGTTTYAIAVKAPVAPATTTARGSMVLANDSLLAGSDGSGIFLQQSPAAFSTGLTGSYTFGLQGDAPCVPACTANLTPSPVATVGQIATAGGSITGEADTNIAKANYPTANLSGSNGAADTNGRVQLSLTNPSIPVGSYPSDFALYMINASQAFVMSTDKHSAFTLLAGSTTAQTATTFGNTSLSGQFVGYENSPTNPGLGGVVINNATNLSTATVFQGTANGTGTCTTNYVEQGGTTALINSATGLGNGSAILTYLLGASAATGNSNCTVGSNGRAVINYPIPPAPSLALQLLGITQTPPAPRVAYLSSTNTGYFLETGYAGLGNLNLQNGAPFTLGTLNGTYVFGTTPAVTAATLNASGEFTANGQGQYSYVLDESVLAGNVNAVTLGVTGSGTYVLTDAQNGRFTFGTNVLFAISPTFFVTVDKSAANTSPSVALLQ